MFLSTAGNDWVQLGSVRFTSSASTSAVLTIPPYEMLLVQFNIAGYSGADIASLRFNGDTGTNYNSLYSQFTGGTAVGTPAATTSTNMFRLGNNAVTVQRNGQVTIYNVSGTPHVITCLSCTQSAAASSPTFSVGGGNWNSATTAQITSIQLVDPNGTTMPAGTSFSVWGCNP